MRIGCPDWSHVLGIVRASSVAVNGSEMWFNVFNPDGIRYPLPHSSAGYQETVVVNASSEMSFMSPADAAPTSSCDWPKNCPPSFPRSCKGFMHMKFTQSADGRYVLGENSPPFSTIPEVIHYYTTHKLPIRGAEHMSLLYPVIVQTLWHWQTQTLFSWCYWIQYILNSTSLCLPPSPTCIFSAIQPALLNQRLDCLVPSSPLLFS